MNWRQQKREARRTVHKVMKVAAQYYSTKGATPVAIDVRVHTKFQAIGDDRSMGWPEMQEMRPTLIFMLDELDAAGIDLSRNAVVFVQPGEAYRVDNTLPPDDITVAAQVTRLTERQLVQEGLSTETTP